MDRYVYEILVSAETPTAPVWARASNGQQLGPNLLLALNQLGREGWELIAAADVARTSRSELFLKKKTA